MVMIQKCNFQIYSLESLDRASYVINGRLNEAWSQLIYLANGSMNEQDCMIECHNQMYSCHFYIQHSGECYFGNYYTNTSVIGTITTGISSLTYPIGTSFLCVQMKCPINSFDIGINTKVAKYEVAKVHTMNFHKLLYASIDLTVVLQAKPPICISQCYSEPECEFVVWIGSNVCFFGDLERNETTAIYPIDSPSDVLFIQSKYT